MRRVIVLVLCCALLLGIMAPPAYAARNNTYPIVLLHGFAGWGRSEVLGYKYWGGFSDTQEDLKTYGYTTYTVAVGPLSSNWDRACEMYAQLKGGTVDYGKVHAAKYGHTRYGRSYTALYSDWGTLDTSNKVRKIHIFAHSQGGQTGRVLVQLLTNGSQDEINGTPATELSPLFKGGKHWVSSLTTISTPHDGTTLANVVTKLIPCAQGIVAFLAAVKGAGPNIIYDFKLDQWGLQRRSGESFGDYSKRVWDSTIWNSVDMSPYDLSPDGSQVNNGWVKAQSDVYYFSWATEETFRGVLTGKQYAELGMNPIFTIFANFMGCYTRNESGHVVIDSSWWQNDGVVNTLSMDGPTLGSTDQIVNYTGTPQIGKWNYMGLLSSWDHADIIGTGFRSVQSWYRARADLAGSLPTN